MKIIFFITLLLTAMNLRGQSSAKMVGEMDGPTIQSIFDVKQLSIISWNTVDGIPYTQGSAVNLGATSFEILDSNRIAYLCNSTNEIIISNRTPGRTTKKLSVAPAPRDFIFDHDYFYVLTDGKVIVYDTNGFEINRFVFPDKYQSTERLTRFGNATYLLLSSGNSLKIEEGGFAIAAREYEGWITSTGSFVKTQLKGDNSYLVKVIQPDGRSFSKGFITTSKVAGVFIVGTTINRVVLDVQTYVSENPVLVDRYIVSVDLQTEAMGAMISNIKIPDCYYVLSNKEFDVSVDGTILNMVSSPQGTYLFSLTETNSDLSRPYPASVLNTKYHFNNHLIEMDKR